jgi:hypothetical protein
MLSEISDERSVPQLRAVRQGVVDGLHVAFEYPRSIIDAMRHGTDFGTVRAFCLFLGAGRSGHTLVGSLLNAHHNTVIGNELDAVRYVRPGITRRQLFTMIVRQDRQFIEAGTRWTGYDYAVPGQWQGSFDRLEVIGDKKSGITSLRLARSPALLDRLRRKTAVPLRFIHHARNPYDNIATIAKRNRVGVEDAAEHYFRRIQAASEVAARLSADEIIETRHEEFLAHPQTVLLRLLDFLGLSATPDYLEACARLVQPAPRLTRSEAKWTSAAVEMVARRAAAYPILSRYRFDD